MALREGSAIRARFFGISGIFQRLPILTRGLGACLLAACLAATALGGATRQQTGARRARGSLHPRERAPREPAAKAKRTIRSESAAARRRELETLAQGLRDPSRAVAARSFNRLVALSRHWPRVERDRAALALGYYEFQQKRYPQARAWFREARGDRLLEEYALYWEGITAAAASQDGDAMTLLSQFRQRYPRSVVEEPALEAYVDAALDAKQPGRALTALLAYPGVDRSPDLLIRLALARQKNGDLKYAAIDFQRVYDQFPLDPTAKKAGRAVAQLRAKLGRKFPEAPISDRLTRAETLYRHGQWRDAKRAWQHVLDSLGGVERERAALRVAECESRLTHEPGALEALSLSDPELDGDRWIAIFKVYRARKDEDRMKAAVDKVVQLSAASAPAHLGDRALFLMGDYYWANLKRDQAVAYYRRFIARDDAGLAAVEANWRIAWTAYLEKNSDAALLLRSHIEEYPDSPYVPDALYWLGRLAERSGDVSLAHTFYGKASSRFAETYFGRLAREREARTVTRNDPPVSLPLLGRIPALGPVEKLDGRIPADVRYRYDRAMALRSIAFDNSAMLEFRRAYRISHAPQLLIDAAQSAQGAKLYLTGMSLARRLAPDLESRPMDSVPMGIWRLVYPLPMRHLIDSYAGRYHFDPMLYASLIRQESGFQADAHSSAGAVGLAQLEPYTARKWSRVLHLWYSYRRLTDPRYNLRVSSAYLQSLFTMFGNAQEALAAYNAGQVRVAAWVAEDHYDDPAEFVESIPFSQTRHYVEVVLNGAAIYRQLYQDPR